MTIPTNPYRGRFAPSPSGPLHFGSLVAALGSYLDARSNQGAWLVRIEDLDPPREKPGVARDILRTLEVFGFEWDEGILYQSQRLTAYQDILRELEAQEIAYPCACTRSEINEVGLKGLEGTRYPGTCRTGLPDGRPARAVRVRTRDDPIHFDDLICGRVKQNLEKQIGDFVVRRSDGLFAYQLAVVIDDAFQGITRIVRGADLLVSTPRQIYLQQLLALSTPTYAHLPLVLDSEGNKLSKQTATLPVRKEASLPTLLAALKFLNQPCPLEPPANLDEFWNWAFTHWDIKKISSVDRKSVATLLQCPAS